MTSKLIAVLSRNYVRSGWWKVNSVGSWRQLCQTCSAGNEMKFLRHNHAQNQFQCSNTFEKLEKYITQPDLCSGAESDVIETEKESLQNASEILANLSAEDEKRLKILKLERQIVEEKYPYKVPEVMTDVIWVDLLASKSSSCRHRKYIYYRSIENSRRKKKEKRLLKQEEKKELLVNEDSDEVKEAKYTIFLRILSKTMNVTCNERLAKSMQFGPHLVLDMGLEQYMQYREVKNLFQQLLMTHGSNKLEPEPFHFVFTNVKTEGNVMKQFDRYSAVSNLYTVTDKSYLDLFPKKNLVYLTPDAPNDLRTFNHDDVYIVGGLVDKTFTQKVTLAKAKEEGLRMAKFPLDQHLMWSLGTKSLTIDQVVNILLKLKETNDWKQALQFVPQRKLVDISKQPERELPRRKVWKPKKPHLVYL